MNTKAFYLPIVVEPNEDGYLAHCSGVQGAFAEGDTLGKKTGKHHSLAKLIDLARDPVGVAMDLGKCIGIE